METYKEFVEEYGKRPPGIVFAISRKDALEEVGRKLEKAFLNNTEWRTEVLKLIDHLKKGVLSK